MSKLVSFNAIDVPYDVQTEIMRLLGPYDPDIYERDYVPAYSDLAEQGRRLASERDDLIAAGVDPTLLMIPLHPASGSSGEAK